MSWIARISWGLLMAASFTVLQAVAASPAVPVEMQGVWGKHGRCDLLKARLTITAHKAGWGKGPFSAVNYDPNSRAIFWDGEGNVDNFVVGRAPKFLVHNTQGFHMPGEEGYARCGPGTARVPWPPN